AGLLAGARAELDVDAGAGELDRQAGAPRARAEDRNAADRGDAAEPLPLQLDTRPDPLRHRAGELRRRLVDLREAQRAAGADADLVRPDAPAAADLLGAEDGDRDHGRAGLERQAADAALGAPERAGAHARALREAQD